MDPIRSKTSAVSSINVRMLGAKLNSPLVVNVLSRRANNAAKEIMIELLFGIDFNCPSPWTATRMTLSAEARPAARKNLLTSIDAVG